MSDPIQLVIQSDDFGMTYAGNVGIVKAFTEGVLTQASMMVACPWFGHAASLAKHHRIPVGVHLMATSEWTYFRWGPLTGGRSLVGTDGRFPRTVEAIREQVDDDELLEEFVAQVELFKAVGLEPEYFDCHMGVIRREAYAEICRRFGAPFDHPIGETAVGFDDILDMSPRPADEKLDFFLDWLAALEPGKHLVVSHCAVESPELHAMTSEDAPNRAWANEYRPSDLAVLTSPEVRRAIDAKGVRLCSVGTLER